MEKKKDEALRVYSKQYASGCKNDCLKRPMCEWLLKFFPQHASGGKN